jgi:hypothetical protein
MSKLNVTDLQKSCAHITGHLTTMEPEDARTNLGWLVGETEKLLRYLNQVNPEFDNTGDIKCMKDMIGKTSQVHYVTQEDIEKDHPCANKHSLVCPTYDAAVALVSERHGKYDLVDLVGHLLFQKAKQEEDFSRAGWRCCIDHIIKPESKCPVCEIDRLKMKITDLELKDY